MAGAPWRLHLCCTCVADCLANLGSAERKDAITTNKWALAGGARAPTRVVGANWAPIGRQLGANWAPTGRFGPRARLSRPVINGSARPPGSAQASHASVVPIAARPGAAKARLKSAQITTAGAPPQCARIRAPRASDAFRSRLSSLMLGAGADLGAAWRRYLGARVINVRLWAKFARRPAARRIDKQIQNPFIANSLAELAAHTHQWVRAKAQFHYGSWFKS